MKCIFGIVVFCIVLSCAKNSVLYHDSATILGPDLRKCACFENGRCGCCGNWIIQIEDSSFIFKTLPSGTDVKLENTTHFPLGVSLDWHHDPDSCARQWGYILVDKIKLR